MKGTKILCLVLLAVFLPSLIFSGEVSENNVWYYRGKEPSQEIVSARTLNTKVFMTESGGLVYRVFARPVHYVDENVILQDIEDTCSCSPMWDPLDDSYSGFAADWPWEQKFICGISCTYIEVNEGYYYRGFVQFNTSGIPNGSTIESVELNLNCKQWPVYTESHDIWSMRYQPSASNYLTVFNDAAEGNCYVSNYIGGTGWNFWNLGEQACQDMEDLLEDNWFAVGISGWYSASAYYLLYYCGSGWIDAEPPATAVVLVSFTASPDFDFVRLNWRTELEVNNFEWLIERKEEDGEYEIIATTPGQGTTPGPTSYSYIDRDVSQGKGYYYRLTDISTYGHQTIHTPIFVRIPTIGEGKLLVSPTMFKKNLSIKIRGLSGNRGMLSILDETGRVIKTTNLSGKDSPLTINWNGCDNNGRKVKTGVYFIRLDIDGSKIETKKVVFIK